MQIFAWVQAASKLRVDGSVDRGGNEIQDNTNATSEAPLERCDQHSALAVRLTRWLIAWMGLGELLV